MAEILLIGNGRLAKEIQRARGSKAFIVGRPWCDVTDPQRMNIEIRVIRPDIVINCAGILSPAAEHDRNRASDVNFLGACNVARACRDAGVRLVHISTDCVFDGDHGCRPGGSPEGYEEHSTCRPETHYGRTKLMGEHGIQHLLPSALILRVPFRYRGPWPYPRAFSDAYQSSRWIDEVAPDIIQAALIPDLSGILHMGGPRRSILEMAREASPEVEACSVDDFKEWSVPRDRTLDSSKWARIKQERGL